jgi:hypothetical protein
MAFELYIDMALVATYETLEEARVHARTVLMRVADAEVEILDPRTKRAVEPAASRRWRDELATKLG